LDNQLLSWEHGHLFICIVGTKKAEKIHLEVLHMEQEEFPLEQVPEIISEEKM